jgi:hypothetical protein
MSDRNARRPTPGVGCSPVLSENPRHPLLPNGQARRVTANRHFHDARIVVSGDPWGCHLRNTCSEGNCFYAAVGADVTIVLSLIGRFRSKWPSVAERKSSRLQEPAGTPQPYERLRLKGVALPSSKPQAPSSASMTRSLCIGLATRRTN